MLDGSESVVAFPRRAGLYRQTIPFRTQRWQDGRTLLHLTFDRAQASQLSLYLQGLGWLFFAAEVELELMMSGMPEVHVGPKRGKGNAVVWVNSRRG